MLIEQGNELLKLQSASLKLPSVVAKLFNLSIRLMLLDLYLYSGQSSSPVSAAIRKPFGSRLLAS